MSTGVDDPARPPAADEPGGAPVTDGAPQVTVGDLRESAGRRGHGVFRSLGPVVGPWVELVVVVALAFAAAYLVQWFVVKPYRIPSESMENTLLVGDRVLVARFWYRFSDPQRGQVIVFHPPGRGDEVIDKASTPANDLNFIKRVVGLPGEWVGGYRRQVWICPTRAARRAHADRRLHRARRAVHVVRAAPVLVPAGAARPLLRDGRQPRQLRRLAGDRHDPARLDPGPRVRHVLAPDPDRLAGLIDAGRRFRARPDLPTTIPPP